MGTTAAGVAQRVFAVEGLRAICMLFVFAVHLFQNTAYLESTAFQSAVAETGKALGFIAVEVFFFLTGYFAWKALQEKNQPPAAFLGRRALRLLPLYWAILAIYLLLYSWSPALGAAHLPGDMGGRVQEVIVNVLLLGAFRDRIPLNQVSWVLSYFMLAYLVVSLLYVCNARNWPAHWRIAAWVGLGAASSVLDASIRWWHPDAALVPAGMLYGELAMRREAAGRESLSPGLLPLLAAVALGLKLMLKWTRPVPIDVLQTNLELLASGTFCWTMLTWALRGEGALCRMLASTPLRWMGGISYSFYLTHVMGIKLVKLVVAPRVVAALGAPAMFWLSVPLSLPLALLLGWMTHHALETQGLWSLLKQPWRQPRRDEDAQPELKPATSSGTGRMYLAN